MTTFYLREQGSKLGCSGNRLYVSKNAAELFDIPLHRIDRIVLAGQIQITSFAAALLLEHNIPLVQTTLTGKLRGIWNPPESPHVELRQMQYRLNDDADYTESFCRRLVKAKAENMQNVLKRYAYNRSADSLVLKHAETIDRYADLLPRHHSTDALRGIEGILSREYFAALGLLLNKHGIVIDGRNRRPPKDPFNAVLSYCYTLLTNYCICAVQTQELDVFLGFMHAAHHSGAALAFDFVEPFRQAVVDRFVIAMFLRKELPETSFQPGANGGIFIKDDARKKIIIAWEKHFMIQRRYTEEPVKISARDLIDQHAEHWAKSIKGGELPKIFTLYR